MVEYKLSLTPFTILTLQEQEVLKLLKTTPTNKAARPDGICGRTLRYCAEQLSRVLLQLFQSSLDQGVVPLSWKTLTIIPVPKNNKAHSLNDHRLIA
ncbi:hypothetical protein AAFF_G00247380 [Aldrovandia affinis]|uniref:Uncharacterized protein n=1 Tax=Aldrovandia affinis TaxID=143900 RepID=A0AAD7SUA4_9TELE|nr:hypothetical protein AAFF_G00247380 [Aldrovandia affinis]